MDARTLRTALSSACLLAALPLFSHAAPAHDLEEGDVIVAISNGRYRIYDNDGTLIKTLISGLGFPTTSASYDPVSNRLFTNSFSLNRVVVYDGAAPNPILDIFSVLDSGGELCESVVVDAAGDLYVGFQAGDRDIKKYTDDGILLDSFDTAAGSDVLELAADQRTMFYTANGPTVFRYDLEDRVQLSNFVTLSETQYGLKLRAPYDGNASGGMFLAGENGVLRLDADGNIEKTYVGGGRWYGISPDPNGNSIWCANGSGFVYRFNIESGAVEVGPIVTGAGVNLTFGVLCIGERDGNDAPRFTEPTPCDETLMANVGSQFSYVVGADDEDQGDVVVLSVSGLPAGAEHVPPLPASGAEVESTLLWTPTNADVGDHAITYEIADGDEITTCTVTVTVGECHLALGLGTGADEFEAGGYTFDTQLSNIVASYPVLLDDIPRFPVPGDYDFHMRHPGSGPEKARALWRFTAQVLMYNPDVFPDNAEQSTPGLMVTIWSDGSMTGVPFGSRDGMDIRLETLIGADGKRYFELPFTIDGL